MDTIESTQEIRLTEKRVTHEEVCEVLVAKKPMFLELISRITKDREAAVDVFSDVAVIALKRAPANFKGDSLLSTYISTIAINAAKLYARQKSRRMQAGVFYAHELAPTDDDDSLVTDMLQEVTQGEFTDCEAHVHQQQIEAKAQSIITELSKKMPKAYHIWSKHRIDNMPYSVIEKEYGINKVTIRTQMHKFTKALQLALSA